MKQVSFEDALSIMRADDSKADFTQMCIQYVEFALQQHSSTAGETDTSSQEDTSAVCNNEGGGEK